MVANGTATSTTKPASLLDHQTTNNSQTKKIVRCILKQIIPLVLIIDFAKSHHEGIEGKRRDLDTYIKYNLTKEGPLHWSLVCCYYSIAVSDRKDWIKISKLYYTIINCIILYLKKIDLFLL